jgi:DNA-binding response OmpR family regulator
VNIKPINRNIKIFVVAERNEEENKTRVLDYCASEFMLKPLSLETMVEKVNTILAEIR